jgi:hypothetical protein
MDAFDVTFISIIPNRTAVSDFILRTSERTMTICNAVLTDTIQHFRKGCFAMSKSELRLAKEK